MQSVPKTYQKGKKDIETSLIFLLSCNKDYSYVTTLENLIATISSLNPVFRANISEISRLNKKENDIITNFYAKAIVCFSSVAHYNYQFFLSQIPLIENIEINANATLLTLLSEAILSTMGSDSNNYAQCSGLRLANIPESNNNLLKNFTNRLINTKKFEIFRLCVGDWVLMFIFKFCTMFVYDEKIQNYIQVLGYSLKEIMSKLLNVPSPNRIGNSNFYFQKVFTATNNFGNSYYPNSTPKNSIPQNPQFVVERTKIYYCPNFNRKLGYFKKLNIKQWDDQLKVNSKSSFAAGTFYTLFGKMEKIIPLEIKTEMLNFFNEISKNISQLNFSKELFFTCPMMKNWKNLKSKITDILKLFNEKNEEKVPEEKTNELMSLMKELINSNIPYDKVYKFVSNIINKIIPKNLLGKKNMKILLQKIRCFISMNRFETFNKINLFDQKEFSFSEMKWLQFKHMSKKKYSEYGILLKNFIMKTIIHWIFDFLLVQLFRSHFFITEKQGDHFRTFYYHKIIYDLIIKICFVKYTKISNQYQIYKRNEALNTLSSIDSAPGRLRLMPKPSTMRPITSFKKKTLGQSKGYLKNKLFDTQKIFKYIQSKMQKNNKNCVVFDYKEIIKRLMNVKLKMVKCQSSLSFLNNNTSLNNLQSNFKNTNINVKLQKYLSYVTMDIEACYDNIDINLLNQFLDMDDTISTTYVTGILYVLIPKFNKLKNNLGNGNNTTLLKECFDIKLVYLVVDLNEYIHILDCLQKKEDISYSNCILYLDSIGGISYKSKAQFIPTVRNIVNNNFIKFNRCFLKQIKGIPQGLSVSSFLCNLFFYEIEREVSYEIQQEMINRQSLLLRFMDDYLCLSTETSTVIEFRASAINLSGKNKFNFNLKKSQSNVLISKEGEKSVETSKNNTNKFNWNGIFFELNHKYFFNLIYDAKVANFEDLNEYTKLINVNLPILKNEKDHSWLVKKISSVLFSGHPWIYFLSSINEKKILEKNFKTFIRFFLYKLIVLIRRVNNTPLQPSQKELIVVIDTSIMKMFSFFDTKIFEIENKNFFIPYNKFHKVFYILLFENYILNNTNENIIVYNSKMVKKCPLLFKTIKRKIERLKITEVHHYAIESIKKLQKEIELIKIEILNKNNNKPNNISKISS